MNSLFSVFEIAIDLTKIYTLKLCKHVFSKFEISAWLLLSVCELLQAGANDPFSSCSKLQNTTGTRLGYFLCMLRWIKTGAKKIYIFLHGDLGAKADHAWNALQPWCKIEKREEIDIVLPPPVLKKCSF